MIQSPQSFIVGEECEKAALQNGFLRPQGEQDGWAGFASTAPHGHIHLAAAGIEGQWFLALDHAGVIAELGPPAATMPGPGGGRFAFAALGDLYAALDRVYALGVRLPDAPLREFELRTANLPRTAEAERLVVQRIGQDIFRVRLLNYWQGRCPLTGILEPNRVECVELEDHAGRMFASFPDDARLAKFDPSDRKFVAVAAAHPQKPPILQATDSKWLNWEKPLRRHGITVEFLCRNDIARFKANKSKP